MKIAIIGGGWLGCHIANKFRSSNEITLFEASNVFNGSSFYNQNRLHKGFHYSRNQKTRKLCYNTFDRFLKDYGHIVDDIPNNLYVVPKDRSLLDYGTFKSIFFHEEVPFKETTIDSLHNVEGCIIVDEKYINPTKAKEHFKSQLKDVVVYEVVNEDRLKELSKEYDLVVNVTNNSLVPLNECYYELCLTLVYTRLVDAGFGSLTMVDGPLFSIYPYKDKDYTVTDVENTPMYTCKTLSELEVYKSTINDAVIGNIRSIIEDKILCYYGGFKTHYKYKTYYTSTKVKRVSESADRYPIITKTDNIVTCVTGKIQGIYTLEDYVRYEHINR